MRQIGSLPKTIDPRIFGDHLLSLGITSRANESQDGWAIWVHDENQIERARAELNKYAANPESVLYAGARLQADDRRREAARLDKEYRKNVRNLSGSWDNVNFKRRPVTIALVVISVAVFLACSASDEWWFYCWDYLGFFTLDKAGKPVNVALGLEAITQRGQVWRLLSPMFLHVNVAHIVFNMWATMVLGTIIEYRRGTKTLLIMVLVTSLCSDLGQYLFEINTYASFRPFGGMSGVAYGLFGYLWMKGRVDPEPGMVLHPRSVQMMLGWLLLGFTGILPMANGAHLGGLIVGMLFGLARF